MQLLPAEFVARVGCSIGLRVTIGLGRSSSLVQANFVESKDCISVVRGGCISCLDRWEYDGEEIIVRNTRLVIMRY